MARKYRLQCLVAPSAGAWIEILTLTDTIEAIGGSLPPRERGLKCERTGESDDDLVSLPPRERGLKSKVGEVIYGTPACRSLRGSVD